MSSTASDIARQIILANITDSHIVIGPCCWRATDGVNAKRWYFTTAVLDAAGVRITSITLDGWSNPSEARDVIIAAIASQARGHVLHLMHTELDAAELCAALWPCTRMRRLVKAIEQEQAAA